MDFRFGRIPRIIAGLVISLLLCGALGAQNFEGGQIPLEVTVSPKAVGEGDQLSVSFVLPFKLEDSSLIDVVEPRDLPGLRLIKGPYRNYDYIQSRSGGYDIQTIVRFYYNSRDIGVKEIPVYRIPDNAGNIYVTRPELVRIGAYSRRVLQFPLEVSWTYPHDSVYVGEVLPLSLQVENQMEISLIDSVKLTPPRGVFFEEVQGLMDIRRTTVAGTTLYDIPAAVYMFIAPSPGRYFIPSGTVISRDNSGQSKTIAVNVLPLPSGVSKTGAVGDFTLDFSFAEADLFVDQEARVRVTVSGFGNLPFLTVQPPLLDGEALSPGGDSMDIVAGSDGYKGSRSFIFSFIPQTTDSVNISIPDFPFYSQEDEQVVILEGGTLRSSVLASLSGETPGEESYFETLVPISKDEVKKAQGLNIYNIPGTYLALIPLPLGFAVLFILKYKKVVLGLISIIFLLSAGEVPTPELDAAYDMWTRGEYSESGAAFSRALEEFPDNHALYYNMALCKIQTGEFSRAMFFSRASMHLAPGDPLSKELTEHLEDHLGLEHQIEVPIYFHPDISFLGLLIGVNTLAVLGILLLFRKNIFLSITAVLCVAFVLIAASVEIHGYIQMNRPQGTLSESIALKRIPKENAEDWLVLKEGAGVIILEEAENFLFIENGVGTRGWVPTGTVLTRTRPELWRNDGFWGHS